MSEKIIADPVQLAEHERPMAIHARLMALLEGLGVPHAPSWAIKPVSEFYKLGEAFAFKIKQSSPPVPPTQKPGKRKDDDQDSKI